VLTLAARDAITVERREQGMTVWVAETNSRYRLNADLLTWSTDASDTSDKVSIDGDTMTGPLILSETPDGSVPKQAATVDYVNAKVASSGAVTSYTLSFAPSGSNLMAKVPVLIGNKAADVALWIDDTKVAAGCRKEPDGYFYIYVGLGTTYTTARAVVALGG